MKLTLLLIATLGVYANALHGEPSLIKFYQAGVHCLGVKELSAGRHLYGLDCDEAQEFVYRDDYLLQIDNTNLCLQAQKADDGTPYKHIVLDDCNAGVPRQEWLFYRVPANSNNSLYSIVNGGNNKVVEYEGQHNRVSLRPADRDEEHQCVKRLNNAFFDTEQ